MQLEPANLILSIFLFSVYSAIFVISVIFTFFPEGYQLIDDKLKIELLPARVVTPLDRNINWLNVWLRSHNKTAGPLLILFSAVNIKFSFSLLYMV